jgi:hypothetical protein
MDMEGNSRRLLELTRHLPGRTEENHIKIMNTCNASAEIQTRNLPHSRDGVVKHFDPAEEEEEEEEEGGKKGYIKIRLIVWQLHLML